VEIDNILRAENNAYHPGFSVDCVVFGFHENQLRVLLLKMKKDEEWALPGGFVLKDEDVDTAAARVLYDRTGLEKIFLKQFYLFGDTHRSSIQYNLKRLAQQAIEAKENHWFLQRFITVGYYALINYSKATPRPDSISDACEWWELDKIGPLIHDHNQILEKALETLRLQLNYLPIGYNLLPEKFTMPEFLKLYETILGRKLDRRNFKRKILGYDIMKKLDETKKGGAHKAPHLYSFDLIKYEKALEKGLKGGW
jgi:8-oxo-dGTP diphosphatase